MDISDFYSETYLTIDKFWSLYKEYENFNYASRIENEFLQSFVTREAFKDTNLYDLIIKFDLTCKIYKIESNHAYTWHVDAWRKWTLNLLLTDDDEDYLTIFSTGPLLTADGKRIMHMPIIQLRYMPNIFYLLNVQRPHMVINYSVKPRYVVSVSYHRPDVPYGVRNKPPSSEPTSQIIETYSQIKEYLYRRNKV